MAAPALAPTLTVMMAAVPPVFHRGLLPERARHGLLASRFAPPPEPRTPASVTPIWLEVPLDWSVPDGATFRIRYFVDSGVFRPSDDSAPIFVNMGGEGTTGGAYCSTSARRHGALCVSVEHRFYVCGSAPNHRPAPHSNPSPSPPASAPHQSPHPRLPYAQGESIPASGGVSDANYFRGLKVEWNLADTKAVVQELQAQYPTASHAKRPVIAFGGSYSGATCAWFRQSHPDVVDACVSSSGVVNAILDFPQFDEHVSGAIGTTCANAMSAAYAAVDRAFVAGQGNRIKILFNASNLIGTTMGDSDFMFAIADGPAMIDQYGGKKDLCEGFTKLPPNPTDEQRIENLASIIDAHYGAAFSADCFYDSECFKNTTAGGGPSQLGGLNSRSWRFQTCSEVAYLQTRPIGSALPPLRSTMLTIAELQRQCRYVFGDKIEAVLAERNAHLNALFGQSDPTKGSAPGASNIFFLDFSDDPWAEASVKTETAPTLPYCMTTCDGCGHCGAGVPASLHECSDRADAFVDHVLAAHAAKAKTAAAAAAAAEREAAFMAEHWRFHNTSNTR